MNPYFLFFTLFSTYMFIVYITNKYLAKEEDDKKCQKKERWKVIKGFSNYFISNKSRIASKAKGRLKIITPSDNGNGYLRIDLYKNKERCKFYMHRLVASHFKTNPNPVTYTQVHHNDHIKHNNNIDNLSWCTPKLNCYYRDLFYKKRKTIK